MIGKWERDRLDCKIHSQATHKASKLDIICDYTLLLEFLSDFLLLSFNLDISSKFYLFLKDLKIRKKFVVTSVHK